jgi:hypothetical protein
VPTTVAAYSGVQLPANYRIDYLHYATIQRPDGTIRYIYINPEAIAGAGRSYSLPDNTTIVIEGYYAKRDENGTLVVDESGHYIADKPLEAVHVRQKRSNWLLSDFVSEARNGDWNYGSFDMVTGAHYDESITACFNCHHPSDQPEFLFTYPQLIDYEIQGKTQYYICDLTGRSACVN